MKPLVILGTRWLAEEMFDVISEIPGWEVTAFVENQDRERCGQELEGRPVLWVDELAGLAGSHSAVCALSTTERWRYTQQVEAFGVPFATLVHPSARVSARAELAPGSFVGPACIVSTRARLGAHAFLNRGATVGHHTRIDDFVSLQPRTTVAGLVHVRRRTYVGACATIIDRLKIGEGCVVGAGALVVRDLPDHVQALGVPARIVKTDIDGK